LGLTLLLAVTFVVVGGGNTSLWLMGESRRQQAEIDRMLAGNMF
jgi:hypothetical protein